MGGFELWAVLRGGGVIEGVVLKERAVVPNSELEPPTPLTAHPSLYANSLQSTGGADNGYKLQECKVKKARGSYCVLV